MKKGKKIMCDNLGDEKKEHEKKNRATKEKKERKITLVIMKKNS